MDESIATHSPTIKVNSIDPVALDCVGLDIYNSQIKNNVNENGVPEILLRRFADDYLLEMAMADNPPSGTKYVQNGNRLESIGVHEYWNDDLSRKYSRNIDPKNGTGIGLIYLPL